MIYLNNEKKLWESKNKHLQLTTHRLREVKKSIFGSTIKSIMLNELTACELHTSKEPHFLRKGITYFILLNISVFLLNKYLFDAELIKKLFGDVHIGPNGAGLVFYISLAILIIFIALFMFSYKKTFTFHSAGMSINFQLRWLDFEERESFISKVEAAKEDRLQQLFTAQNKNSKDQG
ncbi:MAG: hypothetical protein HKN39_07695 [Flavobacteriales bacterium]|nr:hypothetical protein [Flavobacteriales bacterium]